MSPISETSAASEELTELITTLELRLYGRPPDEAPFDPLEKQELYGTFENIVRCLPSAQEFHTFAVPGKTHNDFLLQWENLEAVLEWMPGADEDIVPDWREMTEEWWEESRDVIKSVVGEIKGARAHACGRLGGNLMRMEGRCLGLRVSVRIVTAGRQRRWM